VIKWRPPVIETLAGQSLHQPVQDEDAIALVQRYQQGETTALEILHEQLEPIIHATLRGYRDAELPSTLTLQDVKQQCWVILAEIAARWRPQGSFLAYFFKCFPRAVQRYVEGTRPNRRTRLVQVLSLPHDELLNRLAEQAPSTPSPTDPTAWPSALGQLPPNQRSAFVLRVTEGKSFAAIAQEVGLSESSARRLYYQALEYLRDATVADPARAGGEPDLVRLVRALHAGVDSRGVLPGRERVLKTTGFTRARYLELLGQLVEAGAVVPRGPRTGGRLVEATPEQTLAHVGLNLSSPVSS
jgi:RNA polymerase sigma factor (sigma-70 family)